MERKSERLQLMVDAAVLEKIDDIRFTRRMPSRSDTVRQLIYKGLEATENQVAR